MRKIIKNSRQDLLYKSMHTNQTYDYVLNTYKYMNQIPKHNKNIKYIFSMLNSYIDPSDPDVNVKNIDHAYQTAERIRKKYPYNLEYQVVGLIHDLGKIIFSYHYFMDKPWSIVGDTYPVGCKFSEKIICGEYLKNNPDTYNEIYSSKYGVYQPNCGIQNLVMSYGHDEYLFSILYSQINKHRISKKYLNIIRFHSFYSWHTENEYKYFEREEDKELLHLIKDFNSFDLYSKNDKIDITNDMKYYYFTLLDYFFPENLNW